MPEREYEIDLNGLGDWLRVRITTERGQVSRFTIQYEATVEGERTPVARYDTAHQHPHRDLLDRRGRVVDKDWLPAHWTTKEALDHARRDLGENWPRYREAFLEETP